MTILLEYRNESPDGRALGWRVEQDGRVEELTHRGGQLGDGENPDVWRERRALDPEALVELRDEIRSVLSEVSADSYGSPGRVAGGRRVRWRFDLDGTKREIVIDGFPLVTVAPLDALLQKLLSREAGADQRISTTWSWQLGDRSATREFEGEPAAVPELASLLELVMPTSPGGSEQPGVDRPLLLEIEWRLGGEPGDRLVVDAAGHRALEENGRLRAVPPLNPASLARLRDALSALG